MVETVGPTNLLDFCSQKLSEFLGNAEHKHLAWLREIEEEAVKMFDSNFSAEPELMPKTPSQKKRRRKKSSFSLREENKELSRKRLSRRRSSLKLTSSKQPLQRLRSKEGLENSTDVREGVSSPCSTAKLSAYAEAKLPVPSDSVAVMQRAEGQIPLTEIIPNNLLGQELRVKGERLETASSTLGAISKDWSPKKTGVTELPPISAGPILVIPDPSEANGAEEAEVVSSLRIAKTSTPKGSGNGEATAEQRPPPQDLEKEFYQDLKDCTGISPSSKLSRRSGHRSLMRRSRKSRRTSLAEKYSLAGKRENTIRKSISRAISKKKAAQESSSASSRVSCNSSSAVPEVSSTELMKSSWERMLWSLSTSSFSFLACSLRNTTGKHCSHCRTHSYKHAVDNLHDGQQHMDGDFSPSNDKITHSPILSSSTPYLFLFPISLQKNQLLTTPESVGRNSVMKNLVRRNTPTRPDPKEKERQRLESLRKKEEAELQRKQKVEEEKRRRLEEMKLKREERLRKALLARERVEQMEEEKKKRREQKLFHTDEKVKKAWLGNGPVGSQTMEEDEHKQLELLQKRAEDEQREKGKKVLELKKLVEQRQVEQTSASSSCQGPAKGPKESKFPKVNPNNYGMDLNSDDSTDDESQPRKPIPTWANGSQLNQAVTYQYYNPPNTDLLFGVIASPKLEDIFYKNKPRYFKRTSSAVWHSPPLPGTKPTFGLSYSFKN
uniref:Inner centromere protein-like n=1 Tax=Crocodylus porosus TaxID=8502 RepID=A0A7M4FWS6_CROPO